MSTGSGRLSIRLRKGTDLSGPAARRFPEVLIEGDQNGLRRLADLIRRVLHETRRDPEYHTHVTTGDAGVTMEPPELMLTVRTAAEPTEPEPLDSPP